MNYCIRITINNNSLIYISESRYTNKNYFQLKEKLMKTHSMINRRLLISD